jgi:hypothetical protein
MVNAWILDPVPDRLTPPGVLPQIGQLAVIGSTAHRSPQIGSLPEQQNTQV